MQTPSEPHKLIKHMRSKNLFEVDQFPYKDWEPETKQVQRAWEDFKEDFDDRSPEPVFNFRLNLVNFLYPFVNKRGIRKAPFVGEEHEIRLTQVDTIPGNARLVYKNTKILDGTMVDVQLRSRETIKKDVEDVAKKLYKKAKKLIL